ncbi:Amidohydrolase [compost metagenome]
MAKKDRIINCHAHIFTGDHVPPYLAKTFLPAPFHYLVPLSFFVRLFRFWYKYPDTWQFKPWYINMKQFIYRIKIAGTRSRFSSLIASLIGVFLTVHVFYILFNWLLHVEKLGGDTVAMLNGWQNWLNEHHLLHIPHAFVLKLLLILLLVVFFKPGRNVIFFILKKLGSFFKALPGPKSKELIGRYLNIGRFAFYRKQARILGRLKDQYPQGTGFVILPMDMEYMEAGKLKKGYRYEDQMAELKKIKANRAHKDDVFPFVFADPRRIVEQGKKQLDYTVKNGTVTLNDCFIREYIEENQFSGFKIYPALGYYPFDEALLPLWKYAADNGLPIMTHCIRGTIFFRGNKKKEWDTHPVFEQAGGNGTYEPLLLMEIQNRDFINNFTHPLNFLCLLNESMLRKLVGKAKDPRIRELFGYTGPETEMHYNLSHLKVCFGHFGGDDEWNRFLEMDRYNYANQVIQFPDTGIRFLKGANGKPVPGKLEQIWKYADWYSIICSLMLQYPNVYADLSYIIHSPGIQPLLKHTLMNPGLKERVLYGTDFYVVRNHKSEKNMLAETVDHLLDQEFDQIARINPVHFLKNKLPVSNNPPGLNLTQAQTN